MSRANSRAELDVNEARRREAEEAVETLVEILEDCGPYSTKTWVCLEFLAWEAGVLEYFKKLRSE